MHDRFQHLGHVLPGLGRDQDRIGGVEPDHVLDLLLDLVGLGGRQIDLVEHRHDLVVVVERLIDVGERLRLDALAGVDHQQRALAGGERAVDLVGEVDVAGRVDQIEDVVLAVARAVVQPHRLRLDGDAALALDIHGIEHLLDHFARFEPAGELNQPVGERRFAVVDMGDDREIADVFDGVGGHGAQITPACRSGKRLAVSRHPRTSSPVMPGLVPGIPTILAPCPSKRDGRDIGERSDAVLRTAMPGHDVIEKRVRRKTKSQYRY